MNYYRCNDCNVSVNFEDSKRIHLNGSRYRVCLSCHDKRITRICANPACGLEFKVDNLGNTNKYHSASCATSYANVQKGPRTEDTKNKISKKINENLEKNKKIKVNVEGHFSVFSSVNNNIDFYIKNNWSNWPESRVRNHLAILETTFGFDSHSANYEKYIDNILTLLKQSYLEEKLPGKTIIKMYKFKCSHPSIFNLFETFGILAKDRIKLPRQEKIQKKSRFLTGIHTDWQGLPHKFRSSYEEKYYKILDDKKIVYETETLRLPYFDTQLNKNRIAVPDIIVGKMIYEIKSDFTYDVQHMKDRYKTFKQLGYNLIIVKDFIEYPIITGDDFPMKITDFYCETVIRKKRQ